MRTGYAILSIFPQGKNTTSKTEATKATVGAKQFIRPESAKRQMQARCAAVVQGAAKHRRLARLHSEAWVRLAAELCRAALHWSVRPEGAARALAELFVCRQVRRVLSAMPGNPGAYQLPVCLSFRNAQVHTTERKPLRRFLS
jgi:hypothetical protein